MSDVALNSAAVETRQQRSTTSILVPPLLFLAATFMASGFTVTELRPLKALQIPYPKWLDYSHFLIPGGCAVGWLASHWKWPNLGAIIAVVLCFTLITLVPRFAEKRVARIPVTSWIDSNALKSIESRLGVLLFERGTSEGTFVIVAPESEQRIRTELARQQMLCGPSTN